MDISEYPPDVRRSTTFPELDLAAVVQACQALSSEIIRDKLIERLMSIAMDFAGSQRGLLILAAESEPRAIAEAARCRGAIEVGRVQASVSSSDLPQSLIRHVLETKESVILEDTSRRNPFSDDEYIRQRRSSSIVCLALVRQTRLVGVLYLQGDRPSDSASATRVAEWKLLASQAAISLENASFLTQLEDSETYLVEAQKLSHTGSFGWDVASGQLVWSEETFRIFGLDPAVAEPRMELVIERVHPDDLPQLKQQIDRAVGEGQDFDLEHRLRMPDGAIKHLHIAARAIRDASRTLRFLGAVTDVTAIKLAEEELRNSEESYRDLVELSPDAVYVLDSEARMLSANRAGLELLRCTAEQLTGMSMAATYVPVDRDQFLACLETMKTESLLRIERTFVRTDGTMAQVEVSVSRIRRGAIPGHRSGRQRAQASGSRGEGSRAGIADPAGHHSATRLGERAGRKPSLYQSPGTRLSRALPGRARSFRAASAHHSSR
ncbi:MAG: PAS domain S-box protein [Ignavibacteriota bacterium]